MRGIEGGFKTLGGERQRRNFCVVRGGYRVDRGTAWVPQDETGKKDQAKRAAKVGKKESD